MILLNKWGFFENLKKKLQCFKMKVILQHYKIKSKFQQ